MTKKNRDEPLDLNQYLDPRLDDKIIALPLQFQYLPVQIVSKQYTKLNSPHPYRIHYLGPRFTNTLILHKKYSASSNQKERNFFQDQYKYQKYDIPLKKIVQSNYLNQKLQNNHYYKSSIFYRAFEGMNPTLQLDDQFIFNSCFESGNLDCVIKVNPFQYDLFLRIDSNTRGHTQWFYFSVQNGRKLGKVTFNICNLTKPKTLYQQGMKPYVFSKKKFQKFGKNWEQDGDNLQLVEKKLRYSIIYQMLEYLCVYKLSFEYNFTEENDEVFFAYSIPYTYSQLLHDIEALPKKVVKRYTLGRTLSGVDIPILHITNHQSTSCKKNIIVIGRTHPGESNGSHVLNGFLNFICSNAENATQLRDKVNFIVVPMANPDGVIMGNSRSSGSGKDLNRQYLNSKKQLYPQVFFIKNLAYKIQKNQGVFMFFDFHGHSRKKNTFFYGPSYGISQPDYYKSRALAKMIEKINNNFRYYSCSFIISQSKKGTARAVMFQKLKIPYVFTVQSSIGLFYDCNKLKTIQYTKQEWQKMGYDISFGVFEFLKAFQQYEQIIAERRKERQRRRQKIGKKLGVRDKKFIQDTNLDDEQVGPSLYAGKKDGLMFQIMQQIKQLPQQKNVDPQASSDDHDDAQDLQSSKLKQFNNLIIQCRQKDQLLKSNKIAEEQMQQSIIQKKVQTQNDQILIMKQIADQKKNKILKGTKSNNVVSTMHNIDHKPFINAVGPRKFNSFHRNATLNIRVPQKKPTTAIPNNNNIKQLRKTVNFQTHKHLVSKQFFPVDRCQIVQLPKSSISMRKDVKKGRVIMEQYLKQKYLQKQALNSWKNPIKAERKQQIFKRQQRQKPQLSSQSFKKMRIEDIINNRTLSLNKVSEKKLLSFKADNSNNRIFDSVLFSGFQGMQIDNMAMMIKTFNR